MNEEISILSQQDTRLLDYLFQYCRDHLTPLEVKIDSWISAEKRAAYCSNSYYATALLEAIGHANDPEVQQLVSEGEIAFRLRVKDRLLERYQQQELFINFCPSCQNVANTPHAKQCFQCGHNWRDDNLQAN